MLAIDDDLVDSFDVSFADLLVVNDVGMAASYTLALMKRRKDYLSPSLLIRVSATSNPRRLLYKWIVEIQCIITDLAIRIKGLIVYECSCMLLPRWLGIEFPCNLLECCFCNSIERY